MLSVLGKGLIFQVRITIYRGGAGTRRPVWPTYSVGEL